MAFRASCIALLLASLPIAGCGTVANLARQGPDGGGVIPFGGVKHDVAGLDKAANGECVCKTQVRSESEQYRQVALWLFYAVDLPFTFIGDVVTWPYTVTYTYINQPTPVPPVTLAPVYPVTQATAEGRPPTLPSQTPQGGGR